MTMPEPDMLIRLVLILALLPGLAVAAPWKLDPRTTVTVAVGWKGADVTVRFPTLSGDIDFDEHHVESARGEVTVATGDATTGVAPVDALVRSRDYLDAAEYPAIVFQLDKISQTSKSTAEVDGRITLRGVTRPAVFQAKVFQFGPASDDPARFVAGFDLTGEIDRSKFGSTGGLPDVAAVLPVNIHLVMTSR